ncbi:MAG: TetR/AcrR family transcriptional regulator [Myxococcota bacterium]
MPKPTFLQLPDDKRNRFVEAALFEFSEHSYDMASVSRLVQTLGIAKGSIYQYFGDKFELFAWLLDEAGRRKVAALGGLEPTEAADVFTTLRGMYASGLQFWRAEPRWASLGLRVHEPSREPRLVALRERFAAGAHAFVRGLLAAGQEAGDVAPEADLDTLAHLVTAMLSVGLRDAFLARAGLAPGQLPERPLEIADRDLESIVDATMGLLETGLRREAVASRA